MNARWIGLVLLAFGSPGPAQEPDSPAADPLASIRAKLAAGDFTAIEDACTLGMRARGVLPDLLAAGQRGDAKVRVEAIVATERLMRLDDAGVGRRAKLFRRIPSKERHAAERGIEWLVKHQSIEHGTKDGRWDSDGFVEWCEDDHHGIGNAIYDVGLTGLAVLALLAMGHSEAGGKHRKNVRAAITFLLSAQNKDGSFGGKHPRTITQTAVASWALADATLMGSTRCRAALVKAVDYMQSKNLKAWGHRGEGDRDTEVTIWVMTALRFCEMAGIAVENKSHKNGWRWISKMMEPDFGKVGYNFHGGDVRREKKFVNTYPPELSEAMTAGSLWLHRLYGARTYPAMKPSKKRVEGVIPDHQVASFDLWYWMFGALITPFRGAMMKWNKSVRKQLLAREYEGGSWPPIGPWGDEGGRIWATCAATLTLVAHARYPQRAFVLDRKDKLNKLVLAQLKEWSKDEDADVAFEAKQVYTRLTRRTFLD